MNQLKRIVFSAPSQKFILQNTRTYVATPIVRGWEEFYDPPLKKDETFVAGRAWTAAELRRKNFDDLHKLWYVLYKERNLLLTARHEAQRVTRPVSRRDENRYISVKRSMAAIKLVLAERKKVHKLIKDEEALAKAAAAAPSSQEAEK